MTNDLLQGAYDLHIHTAPDVTTRKCDDIELARRLTDAGMAGCAVKCHYNDTAARAVLLQKQFPHLRVVGGVTLNRAVGGINPHAVEASAKMGGKMVWFPTMDSLSYRKFRKPDLDGGAASSLLSACDATGKLLPACRDVLDIARQYNLVVGTGHLGPLEGMELVREGTRLGVRCVLTHADNPANRYSREQMLEAVQRGAVLEFSFFTVYYGRTPVEEIAGHIRAAGLENVLLTSDLGQVDSPYGDEGMALFMLKLSAQGFSEKELRRMIRDNPRDCIG
ncbi:MAG: DUF6282 family protein [Deltaproteobacteria bacterium]|nr:DUF6282 family protein [Deltaproteobacteria bacterium]